MRKKSFLNLLLLMVLLGWTSLSYAQENVDQQKVVQEVMELSGIKAQLDQMGQIDDQILADAIRGAKGGQWLQELSQSVKESYKAIGSYQMVVDYFLLNYHQERFSSLLESLKSPLLRKITQLEIEAGTPEQLQKAQAFLNEFESQKPSLERIELIKKLDEAGGFSEKIVEMSITAIEETTKFSYASLTPAERLLMDRSLERNRRKMKEEMLRDDKLQESFIFVYQSLSDDEVKEYIQFIKSEVGQWYMKISFEAIQTVASEFFAEFFKTFAQKIHETLPQK